MEGYIEFLVVSVFIIYLLIGLVVVPVASLWVVVLTKSQGKAVLISFIAWYVGGPLLLIIYSAVSRWQSIVELKYAENEFEAICLKESFETKKKVEHGVRNIQISRNGPYDFESIFGQNYESILFKTDANPDGFYAKSDNPSKTPNPIFWVHVRVSQHGENFSSNPIYGGEIKIVDLRTGDTIGHRQDFAMGNPYGGGKKNCSSRDWRQTNVDFVRSVLVPSEIDK